MLILPDAWTWDFWLADTGDAFHAFYLRASRALLEPERRHRRAGVGHAVSSDLRSWTVLPDALTHADPPAFDDLATWTGSVLRAPDGRWRMFYTGLAQAGGGRVQRIGSVVSTDLITWRPASSEIVEADDRWYEKVDLAAKDNATWNDEAWNDEAWRDPWVFADPGGAGWHMLITARANHGDPYDRGVVGHARSADLQNWQVQPPLSRPDAGFGQLEVTQVEQVDGRPVLLFSCLAGELSPARRERGQAGGIWSVPADSITGPFDVTRASPLTGPEFYSGRIIRDRAGSWALLAFLNLNADGAFTGGLSDPMPVGWATSSDGRRERLEIRT